MKKKTKLKPSMTADIKTQTNCSRDLGLTPVSQGSSQRSFERRWRPAKTICPAAPWRALTQGGPGGETPVVWNIYQNNYTIRVSE